MMNNLEISVSLQTKEEIVRSYVKKGDTVNLEYRQVANNRTNCYVVTETGEKVGIVATNIYGALKNTVPVEELIRQFPNSEYIYGRILGFEQKGGSSIGPQTMIRIEILERTTINGKPIVTKQTCAFKRLKRQILLNRELEAKVKELETQGGERSEGPIVKLISKDNSIILMYEGKQVGELKQDASMSMSANEVSRYINANDEEVMGHVYQLTSDTVYVEFEHTKIDLVAKEREQIENLLIIEKTRILQERILTEDELEDRLKVFEEYQIPSATVIDILKSMQVLDEESKTLVPEKPSTTFKDYDDIMKQSFAFIGIRSHLLFNGPSATGKNVAVRTIAWLLNRPLYEMSLNRQTDASDLIGDKTLTNHVVNPLLKQPNQELPFEQNLLTTLENLVSISYAQNKKGQSVEFQTESFVKAMEKGAIFCFDEINTTSAALMSILNSSLDARGSIYVPSYGYVKAHPNFIAIGTMNVGSEYAGTANLNQALNTRFTTIFFKYSNSIEDVLRSECPLVSDDFVQKTNKVYASLVNAIESEREPLPESCMNIRGFIRGLNASKTLGLKQSLITAVANSISDRLDRESVLSIIHSEIA